MLQKTPFSFDVSVWEFFWPLMQGARLCAANPGGSGASDGEQLAQTMQSNCVWMHFDCTPSQLGVLLQAAGADALPSCLLIGGEAIPQQLWDQLKQAPAKRSFNVYGPTEATVDTTVCAIADAGEVPVHWPADRQCAGHICWMRASIPCRWAWRASCISPAPAWRAAT